MDENTYETYLLSDPRTQAVRYIGQSKNAQTRLKRHFYQKDNPLAPWFAELAEEGLKPSLTVIETAIGLQQAKERELYWITHYASQGAHLENYHGNASARYEWKECQHWLDYLTKKYSFIEDPLERQQVITAYLNLFINDRIRIEEPLLDAIDITIKEIQEYHNIKVTWGEFARILAKVFNIQIDTDV